MDFAFPPLLSHAVLAEAAITAPAAAPAIALTIAAAISAAGLALLMQPGRQGMRLAGSVIGLAGFAALAVEVLKRTTSDGDTTGFPPVFPLVFGCISLIGAARMISHPRPVFAALYFILVVIATAGMFLLLGAEFMAFSLVIVYAGAILITYMFVLMLAQQSPVAGVGDAWYDRVPRESISAVVIGFVMLATLSDAYFSKNAQRFLEDRTVATEAEGINASWARLDSMPKLLLETTRDAYAAEWKLARKNGGTGDMPELTGIVRASGGSAIKISGDTASVEATLADGSTTLVALPVSMLPMNSRQVGVDLVSKFPAGLEIAGVVLLMALFGAVILARKQIELGEDERREIAGMRRFTVDGESGGTGGSR